MSGRAWNRRGFGKAMGLAAVPTLLGKAALGAWRATPEADSGPPVGPDQGWPELWPEARSTIDFYQKHLPAEFRLARPAQTTGRQAAMLVRSVTLPIMEGDRMVGSLALDATFSTANATRILWQSTRVAGPWYGASVANAFKAGEFA